jgi:beta-1,4-N-acetylglucosaminyltransferase
MFSSAQWRPSQLYIVPLLLLSLSILISLSIVVLTRLLVILFRPRPILLTPTRPAASNAHPTHLLIVLGSGGHTAEMLNMLHLLPLLPTKFTHRTYVVSSGDVFSALKAIEFEKVIVRGSSEAVPMQEDKEEREALGESYDIVTIPRARQIHQSLLSTPWSALLCLWHCVSVLMGTHSDQRRRRQTSPSGKGKPRYPDLILTNGPGTGVCVILASFVLLFAGFGGPSSPAIALHGEDSTRIYLQWQHSGQMRTIFIESWARVKTLSLSGKILLPLVDRFLVQWPELKGKGGGKAEYVGALVA